MTFFLITWWTMSMGKFILTNIAGCYQIGIQHRLFCGDNFTSKNFKIFQISLFNITHDYSLQSITLLDSITDYFIRVLSNSCTENFGKLTEKRTWWSSLLIELHEHSLQPTTGCILEVPRKERMFWNFENSRKIFAKLYLFLASLPDNGL